MICDSSGQYWLPCMNAYDVARAIYPKSLPVNTIVGLMFLTFNPMDYLFEVEKFIPRPMRRPVSKLFFIDFKYGEVSDVASSD